MGNLFGTDVLGIIASAESERGATAATIAQVVARATGLIEAGAYAEALALLDRMLPPRVVSNASLTARWSDHLVT